MFTGSLAATADTIQLRMLGGFELRAGSCPVCVAPSSQRVLAFLALQDGPVNRTYVAGSLWGDKTEARAAANLRSALWRLPHADFNVVDVSATNLGLAGMVVVDIRESMSTAQRLLRGEVHQVPGAVEQALHADLLPDWYEDWVLLERERYRQLRLHALEQLCRCYAASAEYGLAIDAGLAAVNAEPLRESAHRALIRAHLAEGNRFEASRQYRTACSLFDEHLGGPPSDGLRELALSEHL